MVLGVPHVLAIGPHSSLGLRGRRAHMVTPLAAWDRFLLIWAAAFGLKSRQPLASRCVSRLWYLRLGPV